MSEIQRIGICPYCGHEGTVGDTIVDAGSFRYPCGRCHKALPDQAVRLE